MFRSKMVLILQNTINKNLYNSGHSICVPFSLNISNTSLIGSSAHFLNKNVNETSANTLDQTVSATSTDVSIESLSEVSSTTSTETSTEPPRQSTISANNLSGTLSTNTSFTEKSNPDKLYKKLEIEVRGNDPAVLRSYITFSSLAAKYLEITVGKIAPLGKPIHQRLTVLKSVHVHKKHRVQYETRTYYRYLELFNLTGSTADTYLEYIQRNLPEGVAMKVTKVELQTLPDTVRQACFSE